MKINTILHGGALSQLKTLPDNAVDCIVTSPPYWNLRDYGVEEQLGTEAHFEDYINKLCTIFTECKRVLKDEGTCFVNISDTYSGNRVGNRDRWQAAKIKTTQQQLVKQAVLPAKTLCGIPFRFAIKMIECGWLLRNTIIWHKPNAMPQSIKDRFTIDFEYLFFFTQNKHYAFNQQFEPMNWKEATYRHHLRQDKHYNFKAPYKTQRGIPNIKNPGRNKRSVWRINTKPYKGAHIAPFPEDLIKTPILAGSPEKGVVLDPFIGSGTTAKVARELGRHYLGIELNENYIALANERIKTATVGETVNDKKTIQPSNETITSSTLPLTPQFTESFALGGV